MADERPEFGGFSVLHHVDSAPHLDGSYAAFGKVISGMEVVDKIVTAPRGFNDRPLQPQKMVSVTVQTFGVEYPDPEIIK